MGMRGAQTEMQILTIPVMVVIMGMMTMTVVIMMVMLVMMRVGVIVVMIVLVSFDLHFAFTAATNRTHGDTSLTRKTPNRIPAVPSSRCRRTRIQACRLRLHKETPVRCRGTLQSCAGLLDFEVLDP
jgi:hypothetical protein